MISVNTKKNTQTQITKITKNRVFGMWAMFSQLVGFNALAFTVVLYFIVIHFSYFAIFHFYTLFPSMYFHFVLGTTSVSGLCRPAGAFSDTPWADGPANLQQAKTNVGVSSLTPKVFCNVLQVAVNIWFDVDSCTWYVGLEVIASRVVAVALYCDTRHFGLSLHCVPLVIATP